MSDRITLLFGPNDLSCTSIYLAAPEPKIGHTIMTLRGNDVTILSRLCILGHVALEEYDCWLAVYMALALGCDSPILEAIYWNGPERRGITLETVQAFRRWLECRAPSMLPCRNCIQPMPLSVSRAWYRLQFNKPLDVPLRVHKAQVN